MWTDLVINTNPDMVLSWFSGDSTEHQVFIEASPHHNAIFYIFASNWHQIKLRSLLIWKMPYIVHFIGDMMFMRESQRYSHQVDIKDSSSLLQWFYKPAGPNLEASIKNTTITPPAKCCKKGRHSSNYNKKMAFGTKPIVFNGFVVLYEQVGVRFFCCNRCNERKEARLCSV